MKKISKPKLRFKEFKDDWKENTINDLFTRRDNLRKPIYKQERKKGNTPYYGANGVQDYVSGYTCDGSYLLIAEDLFVPSSSSNDFAYSNIIRNYPIFVINGKSWINNHIHVLQSKGEINLHFAKYEIGKINIRPYLVGIQGLKLRSNDLMDIAIKMPIYKEQRQIGLFFNKIDNLIELKGDKIASLERLKRGYIQKLFADLTEHKPKLRFKEFKYNWNKVKLGNVSIYKNGKGLEKFAVNKGEKIIINLNSISIDGYLKDSGKRLPKDFKDTLNKGDLIMILSDIAHGNLIGMTAVIPENDLYALNQRVGLIKLNNGISPEFMSFQLNNMQKYFKKKSAGTSQLNLSKGDIMNSYIRNPDFDEQRKIANFMKLIDRQINLQQKELDRLKALKKGYLQKMFV